MSIRKDPVSLTAEDVAKSYDLQGAITEDMKTDFTLSGQKPDSISRHDIAESYTLLGITPSEFMSAHGGEIFDFKKLEDAFENVSKDYKVQKISTRSYMSVQFASLILYKVGPESRKVKSKQADKTWVFRFPRGVKQLTDDSVTGVRYKTVFVSTYKNESNEYEEDYSDPKKIKMSVKHATLLYVNVLNQITPLTISAANPVIILTPLAGAIFSRNDMTEMAAKLDMSLVNLVVAINSSCQSGGQYLEDSIFEFAVIAGIVSTEGLRAKNKKQEADSILSKTIKQYLTAKKPFDKSKFLIACNYANGGIPSGMTPKELLAAFDDARKAEAVSLKAIQATRAAELTKKTVGKDEIAGPSTYRSQICVPN